MINSHDNNEIKVKIHDIQNVDELHIVKFNFQNQILSMMSLGLKNIKINQEVLLSVNASHIAIAKDVKELNQILSYSNQIKCQIIDLEIGKLLSNVQLKTKNCVLESLITSESAKKLDLKLGDNVLALIKASELSIKEIL